MALHIWILPESLPLPDHGQPLPESWQRYLRRDRPPWRQERSRRGYLLLAEVLRRQGQEPLPELALSAEGKPFLVGERAGHFSLSHTRGLTLLALSDGPVGVDCEQLRAAPAHLKSALQSPAEEAFWQSWTRLEALGKLRGSGIAGLWRSRPEPSPGEGLQSYDGVPGYAVCVAWQGEESPLFYSAAQLWEQ